MSSTVPIQFLTWQTAESFLALVFSFINLTDAEYYYSNDALRKHGILPPLPKPPRTPSPVPSPAFEQTLSTKTTDEIDTLLLEAEDSETERLIFAFREKRLKDLQKEQRKGRFGGVLPIGRDDYNREVTEASKVDDRDEDDDEEDETKGTGVVCFLYKEGYGAHFVYSSLLRHQVAYSFLPRRNHAPSVRLAEQLRTLAARYPRTKFTSIVGDKCIPNYPDRMLPTLILYRNGEIKEQLVAWGTKQEGTLEGAYPRASLALVID